MAAKLLKPASELFKQYMDTQYAKSYQHYANIVLHGEEQAKANPQPKQEEEKKEAP